MVRCWFMDESDLDQRTPHMTDPPQFVSLDEVSQKTGVEYYQIDADNFQSDKTLQKLRTERGYDYEDEVRITPAMPKYEEKIKMFFEEHIHADQEIRLIRDGTGYFDVRNENDKWIRIEVAKGDLLILPAGIYHRFTLDTQNFILANRYFIGNPVWTAHNRGKETDIHKSRKQYLENHLNNAEHNMNEN